MIIYISNSIDIDSLNEDELYKLEDIFISHQRCAHLVVLSRSKIKEIKKSIRVSQRIKKIASTIDSRLIEYSRLLSEVNIFLRVVLGGCSEDPNTDKCITISLRDPRLEGYLQPAKFPVENNINDGKLWDYCMSVMGNAIGLGPGNFSREIVSGSGGNLVHVLRQLLDDNVIFFCICDSDRSSPDCRLGSTARSALNAFDGYTGYSELHILKRREFENYFPIEFISYLYDMIFPNISRVQRAREYEHICRSCGNVEQTFGYLDLKEPFEFSDSDPFWETVSRRTGRQSVPGISSEIIPDIVNILDGGSSAHKKKLEDAVFSSIYFSEMEEIFYKYMTFFISNSKRLQ